MEDNVFVPKLCKKGRDSETCMQDKGSILRCIVFRSGLFLSKIIFKIISSGSAALTVLGSFFFNSLCHSH